MLSIITILASIEQVNTPLVMSVTSIISVITKSVVFLQKHNCKHVTAVAVNRSKLGQYGMQIKSCEKIVKLEIILGKTCYAIQSKTQNPSVENNLANKKTPATFHTLKTLRIRITLTSLRTFPTLPTTSVSFMPSKSWVHNNGRYL